MDSTSISTVKYRHVIYRWKGEIMATPNLLSNRLVLWQCFQPKKKLIHTLLNNSLPAIPISAITLITERVKIILLCNLFGPKIQ